jgi:hypothetical protein
LGGKSQRRWRGFALVVGSMIVSAAALTIIGLMIPAETMLPSDLAMVLVADGCHAAMPHVEAASNPDLDNRMLTVVVPTSNLGGSALLARNCDMLARRIRAQHPGMRLVPRRAICYRIQRWAHMEIETANRTPGQVVWIVQGEVLAKKDEYPVLTQLGLAYEIDADGGFQLVSTQ